MQTLSEYLNANDITQRQFAEQMGVNQATVSRWITQGTHDVRTMRKIRDATSGAVPMEVWMKKDVSAA